MQSLGVSPSIGQYPGLMRTFSVIRLVPAMKILTSMGPTGLAVGFLSMTVSASDLAFLYLYFDRF